MSWARALAAAFFAAILTTGAVSAQTFPSKPIVLVVPYAPGGGTDAIARIIQESMASRSASKWWSRTSPAPAA